MSGLLKRALQVVAAPVAVACAWTIPGVRLNTSVSLPQGLYIKSSSGNLVEFCPPEAIGKLSMRRGYRPPGPCPDGGVPLLKPMVASEDDQVQVTAKGIWVNGYLLPNTAPLKVDSQGRDLAGYWVVGASGLWVASSYDRRSFDSRYFGPIPLASIRSRLRPLWTW